MVIHTTGNAFTWMRMGINTNRNKRNNMERQGFKARKLFLDKRMDNAAQKFDKHNKQTMANVSRYEICYTNCNKEGFE